MNYVTRWNTVFGCMEFLRANGDFTLHQDKAEVFTFDSAKRAIASIPGASITRTAIVRNGEIV